VVVDDVVVCIGVSLLLYQMTLTLFMLPDW
jgi:hypothetical protein